MMQSAAETTKHEPMKRPGDTLEWQSGPAYRRFDHEGRVLAILEPGASLSDCILAATGHRPPGERVQAQDRAKHPRYVVAVRREKGRGKMAADSSEEDYYAPLVVTVDNQLRRREKAKAAAKRARR